MKFKEGSMETIKMDAVAERPKSKMTSLYILEVDESLIENGFVFPPGFVIYGVYQGGRDWSHHRYLFKVAHPELTPYELAEGAAYLTCKPIIDLETNCVTGWQNHE